MKPKVGEIVKVRGIPNTRFSKVAHYVRVIDRYPAFGYFFHGIPEGGVILPSHGGGGWGYQEADLLPMEPLPPGEVLLARKKLAAIEHELESTHDG